MKKDLAFDQFHQGINFQAYQDFGAKIATSDDTGVTFTTWAPNAKTISVIGDFNDWNEETHLLKRVTKEGVWQIHVPNAEIGQNYMFEVTGADGFVKRKADPFATFSTMRPERASIIADLSGYDWDDKKWQKSQQQKNWANEPLNIYEVHAGSWRKKEKAFYTYRELADELIPYVKAHGYTHIELLPIIEHPYDPSWGYQGTGYFSPTSRFGNPHDLMYFVDQCHQHNIGVLLDWVPGHYCKDDHGLYLFDGTPMYEYANPTVQDNPGWGTANFDLGKPEVQSFLISSALYWLNKFHFDGFRIDAVANMLYWHLDGEHQENQLAVKFLQKLNTTINEHYPHAIICAEDSTTWPNVTKPASEGGLGFTFKWKMGWMNDVLSYMQTSPEERQDHHNKLTFGMWYAYSEKYILPFSHDEVVHLKKSMIEKMPGTYEEKFAQLRLLYTYMYTHTGKKLLFMGNEFAQFTEWNEAKALDWELFDYEMHRQLNDFTKTLMNFYQNEKTLYELDHELAGFKWIDVDNNAQSIISYLRYDRSGNHLVIICNFQNIGYHEYQVGVPRLGTYYEVLNTDIPTFAGTGEWLNKGHIVASDEPAHNQEHHIKINIPPFGAVVLKPVGKDKGGSGK